MLPRMYVIGWRLLISLCSMGSGARTQLMSEVPCDSLAGGTGSGCAAECHFFGPGSYEQARFVGP